MSPRRAPLLLACLLAVLAACGTAPVADVVEAAEGAPPPVDAELADVDWPIAAAWLREHAVAEGRPAVVKFFASWCGPCAAEAPVLLDAVADHPDVTFLGVDHQDVRARAEAWVGEHGFDAIPTLFDVEGAVARAMGARGMPSVSFVDADGLVVHTHTGPIDPPLLDEWVAFLTGDGPRPDDRPDDPATDTPS